MNLLRMAHCTDHGLETTTSTKRPKTEANTRFGSISIMPKSHILFDLGTPKNPNLTTLHPIPRKETLILAIYPLFPGIHTRELTIMPYESAINN